MVLKMPRPWQHPTTKMYYFRRGVPKDLQTVTGKRLEKWSLGTKDPRKAKERFAEALAKCEARWAQLRAGICGLTEGKAHKLAATIHDQWLLMYGDNPTLQLQWNPEWFDRLWTEPDFLQEEEKSESVSIDQIVVPAMRRFCLAQTSFIMKAEGLQLDEWSQLLLQRAVAAALQRASLKMRGVEDGTIDPRAFAQTIAALRRVKGDEPPSGPAISTIPTFRTLTTLLEGWWREAQAADRKTSTYQSYRGTMTPFVSFVGHEDSARITAEDVIAFKDHRLNTVNPKT